MTDIRESGAIEQDAQRIILIHRKRDDSGKRSEEAELVVVKNRGGHEDTLKFRFNGDFCRFEDEEDFGGSEFPKKEFRFDHQHASFTTDPAGDY